MTSGPRRTPPGAVGKAPGICGQGPGFGGDFLFFRLNSICTICYTLRMRKRSPARLRKLLAQRQEWLDEMATLSLMVRGSFFERFSTCSRAHCACHKGARHGPRAYVAVTEGKVQRQHFVRKGQVAAVKRGVRQYRRLLVLARRITRINLELMRLGALSGTEAP